MHPSTVLLLLSLEVRRLQFLDLREALGRTQVTEMELEFSSSDLGPNLCALYIASLGGRRQLRRGPQGAPGHRKFLLHVVLDVIVLFPFHFLSVP